MRLLDTIVFIGALNPAHGHHKTAMSHLRSIRSGQEVCVPTSTLTELDLALRNKGYSRSEIFETWQALAPMIGGKLVATSPITHQMAAMLRLGGMTYFDSLIVALAQEMEATVITKDLEIAKRVETEW